MLRKIYSIIIFALISLKSYGQIDILVSKQESDITQYLDSLNSLHKEAAFKIQKTVNKSGDLMLINKFSTKHEDFYYCYSVAFVFKRIKGKEFCVYQMIVGHSRYVQTYLSYIKDNFKETSPAKWEFNADGYDYKILAAFEQSVNNAMFTIHFSLEYLK